MRTKTKFLYLAMSTALFASGSVLAQRAPSDPINEPPLDPVNGPLLPGQVCSLTPGSTNCDSQSGPAPTTSMMEVANCGTVTGIEVGADVSSTFSGDIRLTLTSPGGAASVVMAQGDPSGFGGGCEFDDMYVLLDDDGGPALVDTVCFGDSPAKRGVVKPANNIDFAMVGQLGTGLWTLQVDDTFLPEDPVFLEDWSLDLDCDNTADVSVTKTADATVTAGNQMTYSMTAFNDGPAGVQNMVVTDTLPPGTSHVSNTGNCAVTGPQQVTCQLGPVVAGGDASFDLVVAVAPSVAVGTVLTNSATATSELADPANANDTDTASTTVEALAPITLRKTRVTNQPATAGADNACFSITASNAGPSNVVGLQVQDTWSYPVADVNYTSHNAGAGVFVPATGIWTVDIASRGTATLGLCLDVESSAAEGTLTNTASVLGSAGGEDLQAPADATATHTIVRRSTLALTKTANGSANDGAILVGDWEKITYVLGVTNNGPSDIDNVVLNDALVVAGASVVSCDEAGLPPSADWAVGNLVSGGSATPKTIVCTVPLATSIDGDSVTNTLSYKSSTGSSTVNANSPDVKTTLNWAKATFDISKLYTGGQGPGVEVELKCSDGIGNADHPNLKGLTNTSIVLQKFNTGTSCTVEETVLDGFFESQRTEGCDVAAPPGVVAGGIYDCTFFNQETVARFAVTKTFSDNSTTLVDVTLTCDTGQPLSQTKTIAGGGSGVTFVVTDFVDGEMDCAVTEVVADPPINYTPDYSSCKWDDINSVDSPFACVITNDANDATFTAYMEWNVINDGGEAINETSNVTITCNNTIAGGTSCGTNCSYISKVLGDGGSLMATVDTSARSAVCSAAQAAQPSSVESTNNCAARTIKAGESDSCTFTNTVFFEGIPTLSQYGLAILALLMLGMGMVGFRRFV